VLYLSTKLHDITSSKSVILTFTAMRTGFSCMNVKSVSVRVLLICCKTNVILQWNTVRMKEMQCVVGTRVSKPFHWPLYELSHFLCSHVLAVGPDIYWKQNKNTGLSARLTPTRKKKHTHCRNRQSQVLNCLFRLETQDIVNLRKLL
jgi:hypothetical protein